MISVGLFFVASFFLGIAVGIQFAGNLKAWRLRHRLFGTQFIALEYAGAFEICELKRTPTGEPYAQKYGNIFFLSHGEKLWRPLTCKTSDILASEEA